jgi:hypothetical protein
MFLFKEKPRVPYFRSLSWLNLNPWHPVFQRLANDKFCNANRCIVITVSANFVDYLFFPLFFVFISLSVLCREEGIQIFPPEGRKSLHCMLRTPFSWLWAFRSLFYELLSTIRFLRLLVEKLCLPVYCLVDCDPYGFDILTTYRFGSMVRLLDWITYYFDICLFNSVWE